VAVDIGGRSLDHAEVVVAVLLDAMKDYVEAAAMDRESAARDREAQSKNRTVMIILTVVLAIATIVSALSAAWSAWKPTNRSETIANPAPVAAPADPRSLQSPTRDQ
jgi:hypothetical protein